MSGGVDSSVTAHLLKERGLEVEGVSFILWEARNRSDFTTCCSLEATTGAAATAEGLGIRHSAIDVREEFIERVIEPFVDAYTRGFTPNPCILCNRHIKFPYLLREALKRGADFISTGHYARTEASPYADGKVLKKGMDKKKDQSYVLYALRHEELGRLLLPLGEYEKKDVREIARTMNMEAANRPESQEICFIEDRNYFKFIEKISPVAADPGPIMDIDGKVLGVHKGIYRYTIGQRKGLGISSPLPYYVVRIDTVKNAVYVGPKEESRTRELHVDELNLFLHPGSNPFRATVKVRSMMEDKPANVELSQERVRVIFDEPQWAPAPGQSAVFYDGDLVIGGGIIKETVPNK